MLSKLSDLKLLKSKGILLPSCKSKKSYFHPRIIGNYFQIEQIFGLKLVRRTWFEFIKNKLTKSFYEDGIYIGQFNSNKKKDIELEKYRESLLTFSGKSALNFENLKKIKQAYEADKYTETNEFMILHFKKFVEENEKEIKKLNEYKDAQIIKNGLGAFLNFSGEKFEGEFKLDNFHGFGYWKNEQEGVEYLEFFRLGLKHGKGAYSMKDGRKYEGDFHNGEIEGYGKMRFPNGDLFVGNFMEEKFHLQGILLRLKPDKEKIKGIWIKGLLIKANRILSEECEIFENKLDDEKNKNEIYYTNNNNEDYDFNFFDEKKDKIVLYLKGVLFDDEKEIQYKGFKIFYFERKFNKVDVGAIFSMRRSSINFNSNLIKNLKNLNLKDDILLNFSQSETQVKN